MIKTLKHFFRDFQWLIVGLMGLFALGLGWYGFEEYYARTKQSISIQFMTKEYIWQKLVSPLK